MSQCLRANTSEPITGASVETALSDDSVRRRWKLSPEREELRTQFATTHCLDMHNASNGSNA